MVAAALMTALTAVVVSAQWPTSCVELNDIVETHLGNIDNIGIYQGTFGNGAEQACRNDHRDDVRSTFRWAVIGGLPWVADGVVGTEDVVLDIWNRVADNNWELAELIAGWTWFADGPESDNYYSPEKLALRHLAVIAESFPALVEPVSGYSWLADDLSPNDSDGLYGLTTMAEYDVELAVLVASLPWVRDGIRRHEGGALNSLIGLVQHDLPRLAWQVVDLNIGVPVADRNIYLAGALVYLYLHDESEKINRLGQVTSQPWFTDGLDAEEVAFLTAFEAYPDDPQVYNDLLKSRFTQHATISLPLAGAVNLWVFQADPFPAGENLLAAMEQGVRGAESLMGAPFPTTDVIVLVVDDAKYLGGWAATFDDSLVRFARTQKFIQRDIVFHEMAHYYSSFENGPHWLREGGANFVEAYTLDVFGHRSLGESKRVYAEAVKRECTEHEIRNINQIY